MSVDRVVQPVVQPLVACIGNPVAGNPTQFVMSRIAREAGLDWRFFTSQVEVDQFESAFRGVQALGMAGASILSPFHERVLPFLESASEPALALGRVSVVRCDGMSWIGDHTLGKAILRLLQTRFEGQHMGSNTILEPQSIAVWGATEMTRAIESSLPMLAGDFAMFACGEKRPNNDELLADQAGLPTDYRTFEDMVQLERPVRALIIEDGSAMMSVRSKSLARMLQNIAWASHPLCIFIHSRAGGRAEVGEWLASRGVQTADEVELMAHQAAVDFQFWTGFEPNLEMIRESLEEYLLW